ncbi:MAG: DNA primase [Lachnospiraceae bacterium]|nr:DNA primase [Lachnospiraceae bacterium]MEE1342481.1 DNA primase [Lachnospiraceae bacterium]
MFYSEDVVEEIRTRNDIVDVISSYVPLKKKGSNYFGLCPFHNEKSPSFSVTREKQMYHCFGCGASGNVFTFVMEYENYTFPEALQYLAQRAGMELKTRELSPEEKRQADYKSLLRQMNKDAANYFYYLLSQKQGQAARNYLEQRQLSNETIKKFGLGYSDKYSDDLYRYLKSKGYKDEDLKNSGLVTIDEKGATDKFWNRVMFPIMDVNNKVIGFGGRVLGDGKPKYLNSMETKLFDKSRNLYGLNYARTTRRSEMIICEGYMDVIALHQAGFTNAVASLGTALTSNQASLLKRYTENVVLAYDSDEAGVKAALRAIPLLKDVGLSVRVLSMAPYKDPDELIKALGAEEFEKRIREAKSSIMFEIDKISAEYNQNDPEDKTKFQKRAAKRLAYIKNGLERNNYIEAVANQYFMSQKELTALVNEYGLTIIEGQEQTQQKQNEYRNRKEQKEENKDQSQKLLLTWLVNEPKLFENLSGVITPRDFIQPIFYDVASRLFLQYEEEKKVTPAKIINQYTDLEEQKQVAALFNTNFKMEVDPENAEKALTDIVKKVKQDSIEHAMTQSKDILEWQRLIEEKKKLQNLQLHL